MPAEWEDTKSVWLTFPGTHTDWNYMIERIREQYLRLLKAFTDNGVRVNLISTPEDADLLSLEFSGAGIREELVRVISDIEFNDTWIRDYGPITVEEEGKKKWLDFGFNGWGLKFSSDKDNLVNLRLMEKGYIPADRYENHRDFILEGGSIESDGKGTILTTSRCLLSPNRNGGKSKKELEAILSEKLGAKDIIFLDYGELEGDDTDSHVDTLARLAPDDTIIYVSPPEDSSDPHHQELTAMKLQLESINREHGNRFKLKGLPFPDAIFDDEGNRLPATYANFLALKDCVFVPTYGQAENDSEALRIIGESFPGYRIIGVDCRDLLWQHGSLHCATMQNNE